MINSRAGALIGRWECTELAKWPHAGKEDRAVVWLFQPNGQLQEWKEFRDGTAGGKETVGFFVTGSQFTITNGFRQRYRFELRRQAMKVTVVASDNKETVGWSAVFRRVSEAEIGPTLKTRDQL